MTCPRPQDATTTATFRLHAPGPSPLTAPKGRDCSQPGSPRAAPCTSAPQRGAHRNRSVPTHLRPVHDPHLSLSTVLSAFHCLHTRHGSFICVPDLTLLSRRRTSATRLCPILPASCLALRPVFLQESLPDWLQKAASQCSQTALLLCENVCRGVFTPFKVHFSLLIGAWLTF